MNKEEKLNKTLEKITKSIILSQMACDALEDIKHTNYYKKELKNKLNLVLKELIKAEEKEFDLVYDAASDSTDQISNNIMAFVQLLMKERFTDSVSLMSIIMAYKINPKAIGGIANKILNKKQ